MTTQNTHNGKGLLVGLLIALLIVNIGVLVRFSTANGNTNLRIDGIYKIVDNIYPIVNYNIPNEIVAQTSKLTQQHTVLLNTLHTDFTTQATVESAKIDTLNSSITDLKARLDNANGQIADLTKREADSQTANQATFNSLLTTVNDLKSKIQQPYPSYPYHPYHTNYPYPNIYCSPLTATIISSSDVLSLSTTSRDDGLRWSTTYSLLGYITTLISNPTTTDISNGLVRINFKIPGIPSIQSSTIQLSGSDSSWTLITANPNQLAFQTAQFGITIPAGQSITLPLTLTISTSSPSAIASCPWQQGYEFHVTITAN